MKIGYGAWYLGHASECRGAACCACRTAQCLQGSNMLRPYGIRVSRHASRVTGFSLVAVLFLIVVVAALGAFAVRIGAGQQQTVNLALMGARALSAANSGVEYAAYQAIGSGVVSPGTCANATLNLTGAGVSGFTVDVTCSRVLHSDPDGTYVYRIGATAYWGTYGQPDYVSRQVFATFSSVN